MPEGVSFISETGSAFGAAFSSLAFFLNENIITSLFDERIYERLLRGPLRRYAERALGERRFLLI